ncbi:MAG: YcgN family cysteine cluster protein [Pseudomonadota bacterium]|nr:YcgN family cysteine cluster protein [Pseudomonadota bacterium]
MPANDQPFWRRKLLAEMNREEWESLCDGCGRCCLLKLEEEDTARIHYTRAACKLLDIGSCRCSDYANRHSLVPDCVHLSAENISSLAWLPETCAYRLLAEGKDLQWWHPLVSGDSETVHMAGVSVRPMAVSEEGIAEDDLPHYIIGD